MQATIFDHILNVTAAKNSAIETSGYYAGEIWKRDAMRAIKECCSELHTFTSDDVLARLVEETHELRALGAMMKKAQKEGYCIPTEDFRPCKRKSRHGAPLRVWKSTKIYHDPI